MKKLLFTFLLTFYLGQQTNACSYYNPDYEFYSLFAQELILEPAYYPFLLTSESPFYSLGEDKNVEVIDENIVAWQQYFGNELTYEETNALLKIIRLKHLQNWKKGKLSHVLSKQMGEDFYGKYQEGFDYLIVAKSLEPYMRITLESNTNTWYNTDDIKTASDLPFSGTLNRLTAAYDTAQNPEIKLRYGFQIIRFLHYTRNYKAAVVAFEEYIEGTDTKSPIYWYAVNQYAGALRGLGEVDMANYLFLKVFKNSNVLKENAYNSIDLGQNYDFENLLKYTQTTEEKNMAYFLLAYNDFANPVPIMEKMLQNHADSDILKVLAARSINAIERNYLPVDHYCYHDECNQHTNQLLPISRNQYQNSDDYADYIHSLKNILERISTESNDPYWKLTLAHLQFLMKDYEGSNAILNNIKTNNKVYQQQVAKMKMLNDIVSQKTIDAAFEQHLMANYADILKTKQTNGWSKPTTSDFVKDILANRYFVEKQYAKAFLMNNNLYHIQYNPQIGLVRKLHRFYEQPNKNEFETYLVQNIEKGFHNSKEVNSFFNIIYGDYALRQADFEKAIGYYAKVNEFKQIPRYYWNDEFEDVPEDAYDGFNHVSPRVFGTTNIECFNCEETQTVFLSKKIYDFIPERDMTKLELAKTLAKLKRIGNSGSSDAYKANKLIGNVLYNTTALGYYRHLFVLDYNNANSQKYRFGSIPNFEFYYKNYDFKPFAEKGDFDLVINYYQKALNQTNDREKEADILFQMARAEQGKYYLWEGDQNLKTDWSDQNYKAKSDAFNQRINTVKNTQFRTYFERLKSDYSNTLTVNHLQCSCSYFNHYMKKD